MLEVRNLVTQFKTDEGTLTAVDNVSFKVEAGKTLGIVGESGCGKSVTSLSIMRLIQPPGKMASGQIFFQGQDLLTLSEEKMRDIRGNSIGMIFQEPMTSLNPVFTCGDQIEEALRVHQVGLSKEALKAKAIEMIKMVGIPAPEKRYNEFPHQLSGGMRQRIMIAMAMCCNPKLLIADEPTTALDVTIQAQILDLMRNLQKSYGTGLILITHDLGVVAEMCDHVVVMYAGKVVESGTVFEIFENPKHPYTKGLLESIPHFESGQRLERLKTIPGLVPSLLHLPKGCRFQDRCPNKKSDCEASIPNLESLSQTHSVACYHPVENSK